MRHVEQRSTTGEKDGFTTYSLYLVDKETGRRIQDWEVFDGFRNLTMTGIFVKVKGSALLDGDNKIIPGGPITEITDKDVFINGRPFPRDQFHQYYELD